MLFRSRGGKRCIYSGKGGNNPFASMDRLRDALSVRSSEGKEDFTTKWKKLLWKSRVYLVIIGMLIALLTGLNMSWTTITAALALMVLDFKDARPSLEMV